MPLFGQREYLRRLQLSGVPGLAEVATGQGWEPVSGPPLDGLLEADLHEVALAMFAAPGGRPGGLLGSDPDAETVTFTDVYRGRLEGRAVIIANAWAAIPSPDGLPDVEGMSVCAIELTSAVGMLAVTPRAFPPALALPEVPSGHPAFDARFMVHAAAEQPPPSLWQRARPPAADARLPGLMLTDEVRQLMLARDDWAFRARRRLLCCAGRGPFNDPGEVGDRISEILAVALAIPAIASLPAPDPAASAARDPLSAPYGAALDGAIEGRVLAPAGAGEATMILPAPVAQLLADRSAADLTAVLDGLASIDEVLSMLATLTPAEHETLAGLDSPLALLAGAHTAQDAAARYRDLDPQRKLQLAAMLMRARDARARARR